MLIYGISSWAVLSLRPELEAPQIAAPNYLENDVFRGHRKKSPPRARRRAVIALNLASGNFDARPTAGLARRHEKQ